MVESFQKAQFDNLPVEIYPDRSALGRAAAERAATIIRAAVAEQGWANLIVATGTSQLAFYDALRQLAGIDWQAVRLFHMDEYVGLSPEHPGSLRRYLHDHLVDAVRPAAFYGVAGDAPNPQRECERYAELLRMYPVDLCCLGFGENGHLAFNDPTVARFDDPYRVKVVELEATSRQQQVGEGFFSELADVPQFAITLTIPALLAAKHILAIVPEKRKAPAVRAALTGPITHYCPASILRTTSQARLYLDVDAYSLVRPRVQ